MATMQSVMAYGGFKPGYTGQSAAYSGTGAAESAASGLGPLGHQFFAGVLYGAGLADGARPGSMYGPKDARQADDACLSCGGTGKRAGYRLGGLERLFGDYFARKKEGKNNDKQYKA
jgi:hypothetical protein